MCVSEDVEFGSVVDAVYFASALVEVFVCGDVTVEKELIYITQRSQMNSSCTSK